MCITILYNYTKTCHDVRYKSKPLCSANPVCNRSQNGFNESSPPSGLKHGSLSCNDSVSESSKIPNSRALVVEQLNDFILCDNGLRQGSDKCNDSPSDSSISLRSIDELSIDDDKHGLSNNFLLLGNLDRCCFTHRTTPSTLLVRFVRFESITLLVALKNKSLKMSLELLLLVVLDRLLQLLLLLFVIKLVSLLLLLLFVGWSSRKS